MSGGVDVGCSEEEITSGRRSMGASPREVIKSEGLENFPSPIVKKCEECTKENCKKR